MVPEFRFPGSLVIPSLSGKNMSCLIHQLPPGPVDIMGDVHGEIGAMESLIANLGYDRLGNHPGGRKLVWVGDLTDRGPDSIAVVDKVREVVAAGNGHCVLGNHDLNLLLDHRKTENAWFYGETFRDADGSVVEQRLADDRQREKILDFFRSLPLALERADLRIVHASWENQMIGYARGSSDVALLYHQHAGQIRESCRESGFDSIDVGLENQNRNPVKRITSGPEKRIEKAYFASGKWRNEQRVPWWQDYSGPFCVFGHYAIPEGEPRPGSDAFCIDFGVGKRWKERKAGRSGGFRHRLAAFRFPEKEVVFDEPDPEGKG